VPCVGTPARSCDRRPGTELHEAELGEELHLIEDQMLRGELVAASLVGGHPAEVDEPTDRRDFASGRAEHAAVRANEPPLSRGDRALAEDPQSSRRPSGNASENAPRNASTSSRPRIDAPGATNSASSVHGSASVRRPLNASTCRSTTCLASAMSPYLLSELRMPILAAARSWGESLRPYRWVPPAATHSDRRARPPRVALVPAPPAPRGRPGDRPR
jgi:hypothetical protein